MTNSLRIKITKRADGSTAMHCTRADGSSTWQVKKGPHAGFFPLHDLVHFAVETELGFGSGFYGLILGGWNIEDTDGKGARGALPPEAIVVEHFVSQLAAELATGHVAAEDDFHSALAACCAAGGLPEPRRTAEDALARVRARIVELVEGFRALAPGASLELDFGLDERDVPTRK